MTFPGDSVYPGEDRVPEPAPEEDSPRRETSGTDTAPDQRDDSPDGEDSDQDPR